MVRSLQISDYPHAKQSAKQQFYSHHYGKATEYQNQLMGEHSKPLDLEQVAKVLGALING